ncbi:unnamed protein product [Arabidopsis lyrata]|nr:unnamed protein product [Arabidopsis lyrata]
MGKNRHKFKSLKERINDIEVKVFRSLDKVKSEPSKVTLLKNGGQEDPEIIEQIFESWSYIVRDLQKYFICDIKTILKVTLELRYYPKDYIIELMSPSMSFLLRTAPDKQLEKGIKRILSEVADPPKRTGGVTLLYYVMRNTDAKLHSKAGRVLRIENLYPEAALHGFYSCFLLISYFVAGSGSTVEVEVNKSILNKQSVHLSRLLTVITSAVRIKKGLKVHVVAVRKVVTAEVMMVLEEAVVVFVASGDGGVVVANSNSDFIVVSVAKRRRIRWVMMIMVDKISNNDFIVAVVLPSREGEECGVVVVKRCECLCDF